MHDPRFEGCLKLYKDDFQTLSLKNVLIIGAGGVGSWCAEFLVRSGVQKLTILDMDDICLTNINRQVQALESTVGKFKVNALKSRLLDINPNAQINETCDFFTPDNADQILETDYDFVIDAMDSAKNKALLIESCSCRNIPLILSGAAGGKKDASIVELKNFKRVENDKLIKTVRRDLKKYYPDFFSRNYYLPCVFSKEDTFIEEEDKRGRLNCRGALGSSGLVTASFALQISNYVLNYLINDRSN